MTAEDVRERVDYLMKLSAEHPSFLKYLDRYIDYLTSHQTRPGFEFAGDAIKKLPVALFKDGKDRHIMLQEVVNDLDRISRTKGAKLDRCRLESYLVGRSVAAKFLQEAEPYAFADDFELPQVDKRREYQRLLKSFMPMWIASKDKFRYYARFKRMLMSYLANNILAPEDVVSYRATVEFFETEIEKTNKYLSIIDHPEEVKGMSAFDTEVKSTHGELTKQVVLALIDGGMGYWLKLSQSKDSNDQQIVDNLFGFVGAVPSDPLHDYIFYEDTKVKTFYCYRRVEILSARNIAQSMLNCYTANAFMDTVLTEVHNIKLYDTTYDKADVMSRLKDNLSLLHEHGVINNNTKNNEEARIDKLL